MANLTQTEREQAARVITEMIDQLGRDTMPRYAAALDTAISVLREPVHAWLDTADIKPETAHETVIVEDSNGSVYTAPGWIVKEFPATHPRWMHLPKKSGSEARKSADEDNPFFTPGDYGTGGVGDDAPPDKDEWEEWERGLGDA